jgi:anthranilate/para-aminobenzoate synthase component II
MHGRTSPILHHGAGLFAGLPDPLRVARYHSLVVDPASLPAELAVTARTADGVVMALEHRQFPVVGWQFHPEAILTEHGYPLLAAFLRRAGLPVPARLPTIADELCEPSDARYEPPPRPVTF